MFYVEAPDYTYINKKEFLNAYDCPTVFFAGGITGCPDWQADFKDLTSHLDIIAFNPRRPDFDVRDPSASALQIQWEHEHITTADIITFWFPKESLCPITLYELGMCAALNRKILVGCEDGYQREIDVVLQMKWLRPDVQVVHSLEELAKKLAWTVG